MPGIFPDTPATGLAPGGEIRAGETSIQAAARRYSERKRRESAASGETNTDSFHAISSPTGPVPEVPRRESRGSRDSQGLEESMEKPRRRSSLSEHWQEFKRHLPWTVTATEIYWIVQHEVRRRRLCFTTMFLVYSMILSYFCSLSFHIGTGLLMTIHGSF